jgi:CRP-like cAMP-binding protein
VEARLARFFLKLATDMGHQRPDGTFIPLALSRQELADMIGTTIEAAIRIMSRWGKDNLVCTEKDGFVVVPRGARNDSVYDVTDALAAVVEADVPTTWTR